MLILYRFQYCCIAPAVSLHRQNLPFEKGFYALSYAENYTVKLV